MKLSPPYVVLVTALVLATVCACSPGIDERRACQSNQDCFRDEHCDAMRHQCVPKPPGGGGPGSSATPGDTTDGRDATAVPDVSGSKDALADGATLEDARMDAGHDSAHTGVDATDDVGVAPTDAIDVGPDVPEIEDTLQDAAGADTSPTTDASPDVPAPPGAKTLEISLTVTILSTDRSAYLDLGFCPDPDKLGPTTPDGKVLCPDGAFVRFTRPLVGGLEATAHSTVPGGEAKPSKSLQLDGDAGVFDVVFVAETLPDASGDPVPLTISVKSEGKTLSYLISVPTMDLARFGVWNLNALDIPGPCVDPLNATVSGQASDVVISLDGDPGQVGDISKFEKKDPQGSALTVTDGTLHFTVSSCVKLWLLTNLDFGAGK